MTVERTVAVLQPLPGIGDMIWHLPHIRAIAAHVGEPVTLIAKPRSAADQLFRAEQAVRDVMWLDRNPEQRRGRHDGAFRLVTFVRDLRAHRLDAVYLLHHSQTLAVATMAAGIPARFGYGFRLQRLALNRPPFLSASALRLNPHEQATAWLAAAAIPLIDPDPCLAVDAQARKKVADWIGVGAIVAIGIGSSEPYKQWGAERFAALVAGLIASGWPSVVLAGGRAEAGLANDVIARLGAHARCVRLAIGWDLCELAALFAASACYVGNDTGVMNLAAAVGTRSYGLFGATTPLHHSARIVAITPPGGINMENGMSRISPQAVLAAITGDWPVAVPEAAVR
ncbi:MAG TPA: glycosyltransferase family 9 protein [Acetobacteraceae bacterium]|nr:glycosyltransferase family 9 protein [Acetobacteraceae bacterium]